jgi:pilus assembly protein CpaC
MTKRTSLEWKAATARLWGGVLLGVVLGLWAGWGPAYSADLLQGVRDQEIKQVLRLQMGSSKVLKTPFPVTRISVANPEIADIVVISEREIYINGMGPGITNLTLWGHSRFTSATVTVELNVALLKEKLHQVLPREKIGVEAAGISVVLSGEVSSPSTMQTAISVAEGFLGIKSGGGGAVENPSASQLSITNAPAPGGGGGQVSSGSQKSPQEKGRVINLMHVGGVQQVMVEVRVAEIQRDVGRQIGVNFFGADHKGNFVLSMLDNLTGLNSFTRGFQSISIDQSVSTAVNLMAGFTTGSWVWTTFFNALKTQGLGRILAEPNLVATSGQEASFLAGGEFPVPVPQDFGTITIQWKRFGVALVFTPTVLDGGKIGLRVAPEVSELDFTTAPVILAGLQIPGLRLRRTETHVEVKDGQTFAIAGLLSDTHRNAINKFPVLGDIPILGTLFRSSKYQKNETELVILVTPRLVKPLTTTAAKLPTDKYIDPDDFEAYLLGALEGRNKKKSANPPPAPPQNLPAGFGYKPVQ